MSVVLRKILWTSITICDREILPEILMWIAMTNWMAVVLNEI